MNQHDLITQEWEILKHCTDLGCPSRLILRDIPEYSPKLREEMNYRFNSHQQTKLHPHHEGNVETARLCIHGAMLNLKDKTAGVHPYVVHSEGTR